MRKEYCLNLDPKIVERVDEKCGELVPRSRMIEYLVKRGLESGEAAAAIPN